MTQLSFSTVAAFAKTQAEVLAELVDIQTQLIGFGESLRTLDKELLNARPTKESWSILECLEHLNKYSAHYLPLLVQQAENASPRKKKVYRPGLLGKPFAIAMHPAKRAKKMKSPKNMNPMGSSLMPSLINTFIVDQRKFLALLSALDGRSLKGSRVPISIVPIIKLHLGDMLSTLVWHNARHCLQAEEALQATKAG